MRIFYSRRIISRVYPRVLDVRPSTSKWNAFSRVAREISIRTSSNEQSRIYPRATRETERERKRASMSGRETYITSAKNRQRTPANNFIVARSRTQKDRIERNRQSGSEERCERSDIEENAASECVCVYARARNEEEAGHPSTNRKLVSGRGQPGLLLRDSTYN